MEPSELFDSGPPAKAFKNLFRGDLYSEPDIFQRETQAIQLLLCRFIATGRAVDYSDEAPINHRPFTKQKCLKKLWPRRGKKNMFDAAILFEVKKKQRLSRQQNKSWHCSGCFRKNNRGMGN